jgi:hypothetical protein
MGKKRAEKTSKGKRRSNFKGAYGENDTIDFAEEGVKITLVKLREYIPAKPVFMGFVGIFKLAYWYDFGTKI